MVPTGHAPKHGPANTPPPKGKRWVRHPFGGCAARPSRTPVPIHIHTAPALGLSVDGCSSPSSSTGLKPPHVQGKASSRSSPSDHRRLPCAENQAREAAPPTTVAFPARKTKLTKQPIRPPSPSLRVRATGIPARGWLPWLQSDDLADRAGQRAPLGLGVVPPRHGCVKARPTTKRGVDSPGNVIRIP
jgi:hypothetical protein